MKRYNFFKNGFTLAEVLITLAIIGVVASMTLPSVVNKYQEKVTVSKLKKIYSILSQSYLYAVEEYGTPDGWGITERDTGDSESEEYTAQNAINIRNKLFKNVKKITVCDNAKNMKACGAAKEYFYKNGNVDTGITSTAAQATALTSIDGSTIMIIANSGGENGEYRGEKQLAHTYSIIYIDINGPKPPNTWGTDLFGFYLTKKDVVPMGSHAETCYTFKRDCYGSGLGCTAWVILNENLDYLKCKNLDWTNTKCN